MKTPETMSPDLRDKSIEALPPKVYLWERLVVRLCARKKSRIGRRQSVIFDRLGVGSPWDGESTDDPIGLGSMSLLFENKRDPAPHLSAPEKRGSKRRANPAVEKYRSKPKTGAKAGSESGTISVREVRRTAGSNRSGPVKSSGSAPEPEVPVSNAVAPLRHRVVPAPESGKGRIRFRHPEKK
jgi:hypothetical protein